MAGRPAMWLAVALAVAGGWFAGCNGTPAAPEVLAAPGVSAFNWSLNPLTATVQPGAAATFAIRLNSKANINSDVSFSLSGSVPPNSTPTFSPERLPGTGRDATLTVQTSPQTPAGAYTLTVIATEVGYEAHHSDTRLDVVSGEGPDFTLEVSPLEATFVSPNSSGPTISYYVRPRNGFAGTVNINVDGIEIPPAPLVLTQPVSLPQINLAGGGGQGGTFVAGIAAQRPSYPAAWTLTVRATSGPIVHTMQVHFVLRFGGL